MYIIQLRWCRIAVALLSAAFLAGCGTPMAPAPHSGLEWELQTTLGTFLGVWGTSDSDVFAVGNTILHNDGSGWRPMPVPAARLYLEGIWGSSSSDVFAVGPAGTIVHYDGSAWIPMNSGTVADLFHIWGDSGRDIFAAGDGGTLLHYDGATWRPSTLHTNQGFTAVWGSSGDDVFVAGRDVYHYGPK